MTPAATRPRDDDRLGRLADAGVSVWLDDLSRELLHGGGLAEMIGQQHVTGATSNPSIFRAAITGSDLYDSHIRELSRGGGRTAAGIFLELALQDVRGAADLLRPVWERTGGHDGYVSLQCSPLVAHDADTTVREARAMWSAIARPNAMIKVPATDAGAAATAALLDQGINVNVTLLFSLGRYAQFLDAHARALENRARRGEDLAGVRSVASFFVSRVDSKADAVLPDGSPLRGTIAVANAAAAYDLHARHSLSPRWERLAQAGARPQRPLWASTATKNPAYHDLLYVEPLIAPGVINTMPRRTLEAFADHGRTERTLPSTGRRPDEVLVRARAEGLDLNRIAAGLETEGLAAFRSAYDDILAVIGKKARS